MKDKRIWLSPPHMSNHELEFVKDVFDQNWISQAGPHIKLFEDELAKYNEVSYCAALSSGTASIHLALIIMGVKAGDEVICSSFTFSGSCNPIVYLNAIPVFVDSEPETWNMDPALLELAINDRISKTGRAPKAIILVHLFGMPAKVNEIILIARKYGIALIEDAAEALGSTYQGKHLGTFGDMGVYSFSGNKIITTSAGGALVSENKAWIEKARFLSSQAREPALHYEHKEIGYNYRLSNVCAGIGLGQLKVLHERVMQRRAVYEFYKTVLGNISSIEFIPEPSSEYFSNRWLTTVLFKNHSLREKVRLALEKENIESRPLWKPMHLQPVFQSNAFYGNGISDLLFEKGLCFPSGSNMSVDDLRKVTDIVKSEVQ